MTTTTTEENNKEQQEIPMSQEETKQKEIKEMSEPFWFSQQLFNNSLYIFPGLLLLIFTLIAVVLLGGFLTFNEEGNRDFLVWSDEKVSNNDSYDLATSKYEKENRKSQELTERSIEEDQTIVIYKLISGDTLLTPENIKFMQKVEKYFTSFNENEYSSLCLAKSRDDLTCQAPESLPFTLGQGSLDTTITQLHINSFLGILQQDEETLEEAKSLFDKDFSLSNPKVQYARSIYKIAFPLKGFKDTEDEDQDQIFSDWNWEFYEYIKEDQSSSTVEVLMYNTRSFTDYNVKQLNTDIIFSALALVFVTIYMMIHTKSVGVGLMGFLIMLITFPLSFFIYRLIFQMKYFISLHVSILFLLMGIGADDIFVFYDSWEQSDQIKEFKDSLIKKISYSYRRASKAMLVTSTTTVIAFLATAISKLMPIMTFGIFAAINIAINYLLTISLFPAFLVIREQKCMRKKNTRRVSNTGLQDVESKQEFQGKQLELENQEADTQRQPDLEQQQQKEQQEEQKIPKQGLSKLQLFFQNQWNTFVFKARYAIILCFIGLMVFNIIAVLKLKTPIKPPSMVQKSHFLQRAQKSLRSDFDYSEGQNIEISFVWGLDGVDKDDVSYFDPSYAGEAKFDEEFDLSSKENQTRILEICQEIRSSKYITLVKQEEDAVTCYMEDFKQFIESVKGLTYPVEPANFNTLIKEFLDHEAGYDAKYSTYVGYFNDKLNYISITFTGNKLGENGRSVLESLYDEYQDMLNEINSNNKKGLNNPIQTSSSWLWMVSEKALMEGAVEGILISLSLAFVVLVLSTMNIVMSFYAIISIVGVVLGVLMIIWARGWEFGTFESMNSIIIIGLSVDYVVHLTNSYVESHRESRFDRTQDMLTTMGVSVLGGGMTTLGAGCFLFGGQLMFFQVMGTLVSATIGFSLLWALMFYPALSHVIGMEKKQGDLREFIKKFQNKKNKQ